MLARKHYAQKGNSKGAMRTSPVTPSSSLALNNKKRTYNSNTHKQMQDFSSKKYIEDKKYITLKCSTADNSTTRTPNCNNDCLYTTESGIRTKRVNYIHKDIVFNTQGQHIEKAKENRSCLENDPKPTFAKCGVSV